MATDETAAKVEDVQQDIGAAEIQDQFVDGFNWNTILAMLFIGIVMLPGAIYLGLVSGQSVGGAAEWVTIILFLEIAKRAFVTLKKQEIILIYWAAGMLMAAGVGMNGGVALFGGPFGVLVWNQYLVQSPQAEIIAPYIPTWIAPPLGSAALVERSFWNIAWVKPILVMVASMVNGQFSGLAFGYVMYRVTSDVERLPFPMAPVAAGGATALAESSSKSEGWRWRIFSIGAVIGLIWGTIYIVIPTLSDAFLTQGVQILPIPWLDFTVNLRSILPTATLGIGTDLGLVLSGFVLPYWVTVGTFIGSMTKNFVLGPILYNYGMMGRWEPGMSLIPTQVATQFDFWLSATIGMAIFVASVSIYLVFRTLVTGTREVSEEAPEEGVVKAGPQRGDIPIWMALAVWFVITAVSVGLVKYLVPDFPWWITAFFGFVFTPLLSYISAKMIGITGSTAGVAFPYVTEGAFWLSGYQGVAIWFAPLPVGNYGGWASTFRVLELTRTRFTGVVKLYLANFFILLLFSALFWSLIWRLSQIPSSSYPFVQKMWPFQATMRSLWVSSTLPGGSNLMKGIITLPKVIAGFGLAAVTYVPIVVLKAPITLFYGIINGFMGWPTAAIPMFTGAMLNKYYFNKRFGGETWRKYAPILLAGFSCGMGLISMSSIAVSLVMKSISQVAF